MVKRVVVRLLVLGAVLLTAMAGLQHQGLPRLAAQQVDPITNEGVQRRSVAATQRAAAGFAEYTTYPAFEAGFGAPLTEIDFTEVPVNTVLTTQYASAGVVFRDGNDVTLSNPAFADGRGVDGKGKMRLRLSQPAAAIGADFPGGLTLQLYSAEGGTLLYTSSDFGGFGTGKFGGIVSDVSFSYVVLSDWIDDTVYLDNLYIGYRITPEVAGTVRVRNPDGAGLVPLRQLQVELLHNGSVVATTTTAGVAGAGAGIYGFSLTSAAAGNYRVRASLKQPPEPSEGIGGFEVKYMPPVSTDPVPYVETADFQFGEDPLTRDLEFGQGYLDAGGTTNLGSPDRQWLDDLATVYYHIQQAEQFAIDQLAVGSLGHVEVRAWDNQPTSYRPADRVLFINQEDAPIQSENRPENREWHEYFHHVMAATNLTSAPAPSCGNHQGFLNTTTTDSWQEGWALFWAEALSEHLGYDGVGWYMDWYQLDTNYQAWDGQEGSQGVTIQREDLAVASVLWDLYDFELGDKADLDRDHLTLSIEQMAELLLQETTPGSYVQLATWQDVYNALSSTYTANQVNEIFEAHGFFGDRDWTVAACSISSEGNKQRETEEAIGEGGRQGRSDLPPVKGANLRVHFEDEEGAPVPAGTLTVRYRYPEPYDLFDTSIERRASSGGLFHLEPPPTRIPMTVEVQATSPLTSIYTITNSLFWDQVAASGQDYVAEVTFSLKLSYVHLPIVLRQGP